MKKILLTLVAFMATVAVNAGQVSKQQALQKAQQFMPNKIFGEARAFARSEGSGHSESFYIFNAENNSGFVIVSGDDRTKAILGYSDKGHINIENMPENLSFWLEGCALQINSLSNDYRPTSKNRTRSTAKAAIEPLVKAKWGQNYPFNLMCPEKDGWRCLTGCSATAMAQIMYYHKWPNNVKEIPAHNTDKVLPPTTFKWDKMKDVYTGSEDVESQNAVAELMRYVGQAISTIYGTSISSAFFSTYTLFTDFDYTRAQQMVHFDDVHWEDLIYKELADRRPVGIMSTSHAYICDGYKDGLYHINWGWRGESDGYFAISIADWSELDRSIEKMGGHFAEWAAIRICPSHNEYEIDHNGLHYWIYKDVEGASLIRDDRYNNLTEVTIPSSIEANGKIVNVTDIDANIFYDCSSIVSITVDKNNIVFDSRDNCNAIIETSSNTLIQGCSSTTIPDGIASISANAFHGCTNKESINIPNSVNSIGHGAFADCTGLKSIFMPGSVTSIGYSAFENCSNIESLVIHEGVKSIGDYVFKKCTSLRTATIPESATSIGWNIFEFCDNLQSIKIGLKEPLPITETFGGLGCSPKVTLIVPDGCKEKYASAEYWKDFELILEYSEINNSQTISFKDSKVKDICLEGEAGESWDYDGDGEISEAEATLVNSLGTRFMGSEILTFDELKYFTGLTSLPDNAFRACSNLKSITLPQELKSIGDDAFSGCSSLTSLVIPEHVENIGCRVFWGCEKLCKMIVESKEPCNISEYFWENSWPERFDVSLIVPDECKEKYASTDYWDRFTIIIEKSDFDKIDGSPIITFADPKVKERCIKHKIGLSEVWSWDVNGDGELAEAEAALVSDLGMNFYDSDISSFEELRYFTGLTAISSTNFDGCVNLTSISLPESLETIGDNAFNGLSKLESIIIPSKVKTIGNTAFSGCVSLESVMMQCHPSYPEYSPFHDCVNIKEVTFDCESAYSLFCNMPSVVKVKLTNKVKTIENNAFWGCSGLTSIVLPNSLINIEDGAFASCSGLTSIKIPNNVRSIGTAAFSGTGLSSVIILGKNVEIGDFAFCSENLASITVMDPNPFPISEFSFVPKESAILYVPYGSKIKYEETDYWKDFMDVVEMAPVLLGDANNDGKVDANDINVITQFITNIVPHNFVFKNADMNSDDKVDVTDIVLIVNKIKSE